MSFKRRVQFKISAVVNGLKNFSWPRRLNGGKFRFGLLLTVAALSLVYIGQTSALAVSGYDLNQLENDVRQMRQELQRLEVEAADNSTIKSIQSRLQNSGLVEISRLEHLGGPAGAVAAR